MPRLALRMRVINYLLILVFSTLYSYHKLRLKATKIFSFLWFSLFSGLFVFIWESMQAGGELLFCLGFVSSVFFFFILVGIDFINSTWIYFPIPAGYDTVLSKRKLLNILKINAEFKFLFNESSSHYSTYGAVSLANPPIFIFVITFYPQRCNYATFYSLNGSTS